ncbi:DUF7546 family protein [Salinirarus marinus]|uniref:DUF7546 family protein n=1 Tax=Salinirarus marinus TaxID=3068310 RepID=UPI003C6C5769
MNRRYLAGALLVNSLLLSTLFYVVVADGPLGPPRYALYGLTWIAVGVVAVTATRVPPASDGTRRRARLLAGGYFAVLAVAGGLVTASGPMGPTGFRVAFLPPGWGPALVYGGTLVNVVLMPARVVGYLALAYLIYATAVDAAGAAVSGVVGIFSCVSCSWPVLASLSTSLLGGGSAVAGAVTTLSYDLSTLVFLVTVALLYWRPFVGWDTPSA